MVDQSALHNRLLSRASPDDFALLADKLTVCECPRGVDLWAPDAPVDTVYFLEDDLASIVVESPEGQRAEAGIIGREGFIHPAVALGSDTVPFRVQVHLPCHAHRMAAVDLRHAMAASPSLQRTMLLFAQVNAVQTTYSTLSNAVHQVDERLARWLLMCHDRSNSDDLSLTHEFMSIMLSVRRPSVTNALHVLEGNGFIVSERGCVVIRNRAALEEFAGDAYGRPEAEYRRLLGPL